MLVFLVRFVRIANEPWKRKKVQEIIYHVFTHELFRLNFATVSREKVSYSDRFFSYFFFKRETRCIFWPDILTLHCCIINIVKFWNHVEFQSFGNKPSSPEFSFPGSWKAGRHKDECQEMLSIGAKPSFLIKQSLSTDVYVEQDTVEL